MRLALAVSILGALGGSAAAERRTTTLREQPIVDGMRCGYSGCVPVATHRAGDMTIDAGLGIAKTWLDLPEDNVSPLVADLQAGMGVYGTPFLAIGLRGHVTMGHGPTTITSLGFDARFDRGGIFVGATPAIAHVRAAGVMHDVATDALAASLELRAGLDLGRANVVLSATPMYAFANDSFDAETKMRGGLVVGASAAIELP